MTATTTQWADIIDLAVNGFNPIPYRTASGLTVIFRRKHGSFATPYAQDLHGPTGNTYELFPTIEDLRPAAGTNPPLLTGTMYNRTAVTAALWTVQTQDGIRPLHRPQILSIAHPGTQRRTRPEKNWCLWHRNPGQLRAFYNACPFQLAEPGPTPNTWHVTHTHRWNPPAWTRPLATVLRCSTAPITLPNGHLLSLWHLKAADSGYWTGASLHLPDWPHNPYASTEAPIFTPEDAGPPSPYWPPNRCIFPMFAEINTADTVTVWAGDSDRQSRIYRAPLRTLLASMEQHT